VREIRRRQENRGRVAASFATRVRDRVKHRHALVLGASLAWRHARDDFRAVFDHLRSMKTAFATGKPLHNDARIFVYENAHRAPPASFTTLSAPSFMSFAIVK